MKNRINNPSTRAPNPLCVYCGGTGIYTEYGTGQRIRCHCDGHLQGFATSTSTKVEKPRGLIHTQVCKKLNESLKEIRRLRKALRRITELDASFDRAPVGEAIAIAAAALAPSPKPK